MVRQGLQEFQILPGVSPGRASLDGQNAHDGALRMDRNRHHRCGAAIDVSRVDQPQHRRGRTLGPLDQFRALRHNAAHQRVGFEGRARGRKHHPVGTDQLHPPHRNDPVPRGGAKTDATRIPTEEVGADIQNNVSRFLTGASRTEPVTQVREGRRPLFRSDLLGDVSGRADHTQDASLGVLDRRGDQRDGKLRSVFSAIQDGTPPAATQRLLKNDPTQLRWIPGRIEKFRRLPHDLFGRVPVALQKSSVGKRKAVLPIRNADQFLRALHRVGQESDLFLGPLALGGVPRHQHDPAGLTVGVRRHRRTQFGREGIPLLLAQQVLRVS